MKIAQLLEKKARALSFEVFPPKTDTAFESVQTATEAIARLRPAFMSVTYGAGGGASRYTLELAHAIESRFAVPTIAHLTCVGATRATVLERIGDLAAHGLQNVMALRGDLPREMDPRCLLQSPYRHAADLIRDIRDSGRDFCIGGACYPETHPESRSPEDDLAHLRQKVEAGCDFLTTQMFFDNDLFYRFVEKARAHHIDVPILPGVMPITHYSQVERAVRLSGSYLPPRFRAMAERFAVSPEDMLEAGVDYASEQLLDLFAHGVSHVHVYTMNKPDVAQRIRQNLSHLLEDA